MFVHVFLIMRYVLYIYTGPPSKVRKIASNSSGLGGITGSGSSLSVSSSNMCAASPSASSGIAGTTSVVTGGSGTLSNNAPSASTASASNCNSSSSASGAAAGADETDKLDMPPPPSPASSTCSDSGQWWMRKCSKCSLNYISITLCNKVEDTRKKCKLKANGYSKYPSESWSYCFYISLFITLARKKDSSIAS